jgi:hypothetical protein
MGDYVKKSMSPGVNRTRYLALARVYFAITPAILDVR